MKLLRLIFWFLVSVMAAVFAAVGFLFIMVATTPPAHASAWNEHTCVSAAEDTGTLHDFKTQGMTWAEAEPQIMMALDAAMTNHESYVKDAVDVQRSYMLAKMVWDYEMTRDMAVDAAFTICMHKWQGVEI